MTEPAYDRQLRGDVDAIAKKHKVPLHFCMQLILTEIREGVPIPDALTWLDNNVSKFAGRVK